MQVRWNRFDALLNEKKSVAQGYFFYGDEACIQMELRDALIPWLESKGFERDVVHWVEQGNMSWEKFNADLEGMSLFSRQTQLDIRVATEKWPAEGTKWVSALSERWHSDTVIILSMPKLDRSTLNTKWFQSLEKQDVVMVATPALDRSGFKEWLQLRAQAYSLRFKAEALDIFLHAMEGNLFAARQVLERLKLSGCEGDITIAHLESYMDQAARYELQQLSEAWLVGDQARCLEVLSMLRVDADAIPLIVWQLGEDIHAWWALSQRKSPTMLWGARKTAMEKRVQYARLGREQFSHCIAALTELDRSFKGVSTQGMDVWDQLEALVLSWALGPQRNKKALI
jgi:DNA polymerase III subunit delta